MNKYKPTEHRLTWTAEGLNVFLPIYNDIEELQISKKNDNQQFANGNTHYKKF